MKCTYQGVLRFTFILLTLCSAFSIKGQAIVSYDVIVIGGGASGISAGITAGRLGAKTLIIEEGPWLGGMITSAGVSAFDGNHRIAGGIFAEFRDSLYAYYGGPASVETGWVSNTLFEPKIGNRIFSNMVRRTPGLKVLYNSLVNEINYREGIWHVRVSVGDTVLQLASKNLIDATELGDIMDALGVPLDIGMDSGPLTQEPFAPEIANDIVQDLTWVAILQEFKEGKNHLLSRPEGYNPELFRCSCDTRDPSTTGSPLIDCRKMLDYGKLPNGKYMINWPNCGNDIYLNILNLNRRDREVVLQQAKQRTLAFVYYLQHELGFTHLGLALDEFPTEDRLALMPYHRESRRLQGKARLKVQHLLHPFDSNEAYYRTGIAVGDYPIDHHHKQNQLAPPIDFINIKAPSYNIPVGSLLPAAEMPLIVAEKSISVSNVVNGTTRLQPVVLGIGQAAGTIAALASKNDLKPEDVPVRQIQQALLDQGAYIMPYMDVSISDPHFKAIQRIGSTGLLRGRGIPYKWANQTWFYPDSASFTHEIYPDFDRKPDGTHYLKEDNNRITTPNDLVNLLSKYHKSITIQEIKTHLQALFPMQAFTSATPLTRRQVAVVVDHVWNPFMMGVDFEGHIIEPKK